MVTNKSSNINNKEHNHSNQSKNSKEAKERIIDKIKSRNFLDNKEAEKCNKNNIKKHNYSN